MGMGWRGPPTSSALTFDAPDGPPRASRGRGGTPPGTRCAGPAARWGRAATGRWVPPSVEEQVGRELLARLHRVLREVGDALGAEHVLVEEEVPGAGAGIAPQDRDRRVRDDLRGAAVPRELLAAEQVQRRRRD